MTVGLISYGVVHLLIAWISLQLAWGLGGGEASQKGALAELAAQPFGSVLLWIIAVGFFALVIWQGIEALWGHRDQTESGKRTRKRIGSAGKAVVYAALGVTAVTIALSGKSSSGNSGEKTMTAKLLSVPFGRFLVIAVGIVILVLGARNIWRGVTKKFTHDLVGGVGQGTVRLGQAGYIAKGIAFGIVGILFGWAGITADPNKAGGMDSALRTLLDQPFGPVLLTLVGLGIACFGLYCFVWSRNAKHEAG